ncbi:MAG TPA: MFS transporter [Usitatibacter sp.]|nr:MFS transporter [Usitatibacter sp.]
MQLQRMEAGIAREDFPYRARRGIAVEHAADVFTDAAEHRAIIRTRAGMTSLLFPTSVINYFPLLKRFARKYVEFVRQPDVGPLLAVALFARMPIGMLAFSMLMFLREALGDFARAGAAVGINFVVMAVAAPVQGRLIDRFGPRKLLYVTGVVQPLALCGLLASAKLGLPFAFLVAFAALAGGFASPITTPMP